MGKDVFQKTCFHSITDFRLEVDRQGNSCTKPQFMLRINSVLDHSGSFWSWNVYMSPYRRGQIQKSVSPPCSVRYVISYFKKALSHTVIEKNPPVPALPFPIFKTTNFHSLNALPQIPNCISFSELSSPQGRLWVEPTPLSTGICPLTG